MFRARLLPAIVSRGPRRRRCGPDFDDGPTPGDAAGAGLLDRHGQAAFFVIGEKAGAPDCREILAGPRVAPLAHHPPSHAPGPRAIARRWARPGGAPPCGINAGLPPRWHHQPDLGQVCWTRDFCVNFSRRPGPGQPAVAGSPGAAARGRARDIICCTTRCRTGRRWTASGEFDSSSSPRLKAWRSGLWAPPGAQVMEFERDNLVTCRTPRSHHERDRRNDSRRARKRMKSSIET